MRPTTLLVTGGNGFLGQAIRRYAAEAHPEAQLILIPSISSGGLDLTAQAAIDWLAENISLAAPADTTLIHAAAVVAWDARAGLLGNAAMALNISRWAAAVGIGFSVFVGGVNVYPLQPEASLETACDPPTLYGWGKWVAERIWQHELAEKQQAIVRLAGLWGWQARPTLFWNHLLRAATDANDRTRPVVNRRRSRRNYIPVDEAASCIVEIALLRSQGLFLAAGLDVVELGEYVDALRTLPGSHLVVEWQDDGRLDEQVYVPSPELKPLLNPFPIALQRLWEMRQG